MEQFGFGAKYFHIGMGVSAGITETSRKTFSQNQFLGEAHIGVTCFNLGFVGTYDDILDPNFRKALEALPPAMSTENEKLQYATFIRRYGTHFFNFITFGGVATMETQMDKSLSSYYSEQELNAQLSAEFFFLSGSFTGISGSTNVDAYFQENSVSTIKLSGGNTSAYLPNEWQSWVHTVYYDPVPVNSKIASLSFLSSNASIQANLDKAIVDYLDGSAAAYCAADICNGHGQCQNNGGCVCDNGWTGEGCGESSEQTFLITASFEMGSAGLESEVLLPADRGFCFLTRGQGWFQSMEHCKLDIKSEHWVLEKNSGQTYMLCGARCFLASEDGNGLSFAQSFPAPWSLSWTLTQETVLQGTGSQSSYMIAIEDGFCFFVEGQAWYQGMEGCNINAYGGQWVLNSTSNRGDFTCGARCVVFQRSAVMHPLTATQLPNPRATPIPGLWSIHNFYQVSKEFSLTGTGTTQATMVKSEGTFCFIVEGQSWYQGGEHCKVYVSGSTWVLWKSSGQSGFVCGARCISFL